MHLFVFGYGYSASHFVDSLDKSEVTIEGVTVRSTDKALSLAAHGLKPLVFDGEHPGEGIAGALYRATHLIISAPPGHEAPAGAHVGGANARAGDPVLRWYFDEIAHGSPNLEWIGYLSTVGVYGDHDGAWVDEETPPEPVSKRSKARIEAENAWVELGKTRGVPVAILRLSGIYGPGRNSFVSLKNGTAKRLVKPGQVFNRIHVDDIAGALSLLADKRLGGIFNVTDDEPAPPQDVVLHAAELVGTEPPGETDFAVADLSPMARSFYGENKRVSNAKLKEAGYSFRYPTYREGLAGLTGDFKAG
ncbi:SDR family NAD(P)-dependent oxidoreductase [Jiella marina]|uniref:SDR family NAD(P)-dependent oxidoreductase n=1 Tax=Jiella sp. LLJ827 TaxID=2917712 RepID=UPI0021011BCE|nr:SDR family NAD(P)-dependent oxidoreductase [Jiella sp. LLJ827]MCQ0986767.1 SDR family NAD(P)-dependent oxidoreductase [Jiella sp. LLJ827]